MNKYQKAIEVIDTLLHLMCGEEREDGCIKFERNTENVDEGLIEFDLYAKTVYVSWFGNPKDITIAELKAINKQAEELGWI